MTSNALCKHDTMNINVCLMQSSQFTDAGLSPFLSLIQDSSLNFKKPV